MDSHVALIGTALYKTVPTKAHWANLTLPSEYRAASLGSLMYPTDGILTVHHAYNQARARLRKMRPRQNHFNVVVCHIDSAGTVKTVTAISEGRAVDTVKVNVHSLLWPGSADPSMITTAANHLSKKIEYVWQDLAQEQQNKLSSGRSSGGWWKRVDADISSAYIYQLSKTIIGVMLGLKGPLDAIVFSSHSEELSSVTSAKFRQRCIDQLHQLVPFVLDGDRNRCSGAKSNGVLTVAGTWPVVLRLSENIGLKPEALIYSDLVTSVAPPPPVKEEPVITGVTAETREGPASPQQVNKVTEYMLAALALD